MEMIELTNDTFTKDILDGTTFFKIAEGGAMGEMGDITYVTEDCKVYHGNYCFGDLKLNTVMKAFPVLSKCHFTLFGIDSIVPRGWKYINLHCGNHLIVREDFYEEFAFCVSLYAEPVEIYQNWVELALSIMDDI